MLGHHTQLGEDDRDHHRGEEFKEALDPQVDDPKPPGMHHRKMAGAIKEHGRQVKHRDGQGRIQKQRGHFTALRILAGGCDTSPEQAEPQDEPNGQEYLPGPSQVKILPALMPHPKPEIAEETIDA
jgi:hypothetical protein